MTVNRKIAVIGADEPVGASFLRAMQAKKTLDESRIVPISLDTAEGGSVRLRGEELPCVTADEVDWSAVDVVVLTAWGKAGEDLAGEALRRGCQVVATAGRLVAATGRLHEADDAVSTAILRICRPVAALAGLESVGGFVGLPVGLRGRGGIDELANQARALFAMEDAEPEVFPVQIAFNLIPQVGAIAADGLSGQETAMRLALRRALGEELAVHFMAAWLPTFYGGVAAVQGRCRNALDGQELRSRIGHIEGLILMDSDLPGGAPTPAVDALDSEDVFVGRLRMDPHDPTRFSLWLTFDGPRLEAAQLLAIQENID